MHPGKLVRVAGATMHALLESRIQGGAHSIRAILNQSFPLKPPVSRK
jgi:hypothetical protein